ncbi:MAG: oligosaccharide flippase family protein [Eubacterium sp.]|nr:oligosaccharide flippase family protein [Eubacterium sp.]
MNETEKAKSKALITGTFIYAIGNLGTKILSFIIVPLYTYYIDPSDMGDYDLVNTTVSLLTPLLTLQIMDAAYAWMMRKESKSPDYIVAVYKFLITTSILSSAIILAVNYFVTIKYCYYMIALLTLGRIFSALHKLLRGLRNQKLFTIFGILYTAIFLLLNLLQIVVLKQGVKALFQSAIISYSFCIVLLFICEKRLRQVNFKTKSLSLQKEMLKFSIPLVPNQLNWWIMNSLDRYIIRFFLGSVSNGIYAIAYKFPSLLQLIFNIFYLSWQDAAIVDKDKNPGEFYTKVFKLYYKISFSFLVFLIPFTKIFILIAMNEAYHSAINYIGFLYLGTVFQAFSSFFGVGYLKNDKTSQAATTSIYGAIINAVVNLAFIKLIGLYAAAISTFIAFLVMFIVRVIQTRKTMPIKIEYFKFIVLFLISLATVIISIFTQIKYDIVLLVIGAVLFVIVNRNEILNIIKSLVNKLKKGSKS